MDDDMDTSDAGVMFNMGGGVVGDPSGYTQDQVEGNTKFKLFSRYIFNNLFFNFRHERST